MFSHVWCCSAQTVLHHASTNWNIVITIWIWILLKIYQVIVICMTWHSHYTYVNFHTWCIPVQTARNYTNMSTKIMNDLKDHLSSVSSVTNTSLFISTVIWWSSMDPGGLLQCACATATGLGDVCLCHHVLLFLRLPHTPCHRLGWPHQHWLEFLGKL